MHSSISNLVDGKGFAYWFKSHLVKKI
jgi:hypothetical protein